MSQLGAQGGRAGRPAFAAHKWALHYRGGGDLSPLGRLLRRLGSVHKQLTSYRQRS